MTTIAASKLGLSEAVVQAIDETDVVSRERALAQLDDAVHEAHSFEARESYRSARMLILALPNGTCIDVTR